MPGWYQRFELARRHVAEGRHHIFQQRDLIERQRDGGFSTVRSEQLLAMFESIQEGFEEDLDSIQNEADNVGKLFAAATFE